MPADFCKDIRTVVTFKEVANSKTEMTVTGTKPGQNGCYFYLNIEQNEKQRTAHIGFGVIKAGLCKHQHFNRYRLLFGLNKHR